MARTAWIVGAVMAGSVAISLAGSRSLSAQTAPPGAPPAGAVNVEADPIRCWWRTGASAVRVGEPFSLVLTCAVVDNDTTTVVADHSRLDPAAVQMPPFEVIGGQREPDIKSDQRRFFQYQYRLRIINEELFGKDATIPSVQINYHVESKVERGESVRGRDKSYILPSESVRVLSLVPTNATDIRDAPSFTFGDIEAQRFRSRVYLMVASILFVASALVVAVALLRYLRRNRQAGVIGRRLISDGAILRGVGRELASVRRASTGEGWTVETAGRALAAFRIAGNVGLGHAVGQVPARSGARGHDGQLPIRGGWLLGKKALVSGSATGEAIGRRLSTGEGSAGHRQALEQLQTALATFTAALFGRESALDASALSAALDDAPTAVGRLKRENLWIVKKLRRFGTSVGELGNRVWAR